MICIQNLRVSQSQYQLSNFWKQGSKIETGMYILGIAFKRMVLEPRLRHSAKAT